MIKIKYLFWKIFFSFLLASVLVMATTMYLVVRTWEFERLEQRHKDNAEKLVARLVTLYEQGETQKIERIQKRINDNTDKRHEKRRRWLPIKIVDAQGNVVIDNLPKQYRSRKMLEFTYQSLSGKVYTINTLIGPPPRFLQVLHKINLVQFVLMVIASAGVSALLSWSITRPLKKLSEYSRYYAAHKTPLAMDDHLLQRADEIGTLARDFNSMIDEVERSIRSQKQLLHDVSHELRAPLSRLQVAAALLENKAPESAPNIERINMECERIDHLIQEILDFSRLEQHSHEKSSFELSETIQAIVEDIRFQYPERAINLLFEDKTISVHGYPDLFARSFSNIIINACKHTKENTAIDIQLQAKSDQSTIVVRDHGAGVKESDLNHLFQFFYRADNNMHTEGFGLGLGIAKRAMEMNNGDVQIRNHPDGGFEVSLIFKLKKADRYER